MKILREDNKFYPEKLKQIYDRPAKLYIEGNKEILNSKSIAIIGSRNCTKYGANTSYMFGYALAKAGITIISGLARGIDSYSHIGAISAKGKTIAVLGSGFNNIYPKENINLCRNIIKNNGAIITEYEPDAKPEKIHFPARNRIISALSDGILVVEATHRSGTLITVDFGLEHGKDIFCIPGNIDNQHSYNTNELIKQGAFLVTKPQDILDIIY